MLTIKMDSNMKQTAKEKAENMVENGLYSRFNLPKHERIDKAKTGCLGEIAFQHVLEKEGISYQLDQTDFSHINTDEFDFMVNEKLIDVKVAKKSTSSKPNDNWTYGYPEEQHPANKDYIIVGWVDLLNNEVGFYGWITGEQVASYPVVTKNGYRGYEYLTPNHEFRWGDLNKYFHMLWALL